VKLRSHRVRFGMALITLAALAVLSGACLPTLEPESSQSPVVLSFEAEYEAVYPRGASEIECTVSEPEGDEVAFMWSCTGGSLAGAGPAVTWQAPNSYGDYHIMVIAKDDEGRQTTATLTIAVVPRPDKGGCCGR